MAPNQQLQQAAPMSPSQGGAISIHLFEKHEVRVCVDDAGQPWFNANDVCTVLEFGNPRQAVESHVDAEDVQKLDSLTLGGRQRQNHVNESGLYALILGSTKVAAKRFKRWVTSEVLPSIRRTGTYTMPAKQPALPDFTNPAEAARAWATQFEQRAALEHKVAVDAPKVEAHDRLAAAEGDLCIRAAAKCLKLPERKFTSWIVEHGWAHRHGGGKRLTGYAEKEKAGLVRHRVKTIERSCGEHEAVSQLLFTPRGMISLAREIIASERARESVPRPVDLFSRVDNA